MTKVNTRKPRQQTAEGDIDPGRRHKARHFALQAVYEWQLSGNEPGEIVTSFIAEQPMQSADHDYFRELVMGVTARAGVLDAAFSPYLSRPLADLDQVDKAILRIGAYELTEHPEVPFRVVINEAIMLAKAFAGQDSHKFVNGVLDKLVRARDGGLGQ